MKPEREKYESRDKINFYELLVKLLFNISFVYKELNEKVYYHSFFTAI